MPALAPLAIAAVSAAASVGTTAALTGAVIAGITISSTTALIIGAVAGVIVAGVGSLLLGALFKPKGAGGAVAQDRSQTIRSAIAPRQVIYGRVLVSGPMLYIGSSGADRQYFNMVIALAGHAVDDFEEVHLNDKVITLVTAGTGGALDAADRSGGVLSGKVLIHTYDGTQTTADSKLISESGGEWTSDHKLLGVAYLYVRIEYDKDIFPSGFQSIAAVVRGKRLFDPRDSSTSWSTNAALALRDYLASPYGLNASDDEIDDGFMEAAANACDETVWLDMAETTSQKRYELNGSFRLDQTPISIVEGLLSACGGTLVYVQGAYRLSVAHYDSPIWTLSPSDFSGNISVVTQISRRELANQITGTYIEPAQSWAAVSFPAVTLADAITADGEVLVADAQFDFTTDVAMVQRLARIQALRGRRPIRAELPLKYRQIKLACWDCVAVTMPDFGWDNKPFRVWTWKFDPVTGFVAVTIQEDDADIYSWTALDAAPPAAVATPTVIDPLVVPAPTGLTVTATTALNGDGGTSPALLVTWSTVPHPFITAYEVQWRVTGATDWNSLQVPTPGTQAVLAPMISGTSYDVRVRGVAALVRGAWTSTSTESAVQDTTAPGVPTSFTAAAAPGAIALTWTKPTDGDLAAIEVHVNVSSSTTGRTYLAETSGGGYRHGGLSGGTELFYWIRARDRTGNLSAFTGPQSATADTFITTDLASNAVSEAYVTSATSGLTVGTGGPGYVDDLTLTISVPAGCIVILYISVVGDSADWGFRIVSSTAGTLHEGPLLLAVTQTVVDTDTSSGGRTYTLGLTANDSVGTVYDRSLTAITFKR